jgi:hypothetical protein
MHQEILQEGMLIRHKTTTSLSDTTTLLEGSDGNRHREAFDTLPNTSE